VKLRTVAASIADGSAIDWADAAQASPLVEQLKILARIAAVHRTAPGEGGSSTDGVAGAATAAVGRWGSLALLEPIGAGASGEVYRAWDSQLQREVALKLLRFRDGPEDIDTSCVADEGRMLARVRHPNVVTVYGAAAADGRVGLWMELIDGMTLAQLIAAQGPLSAREAMLAGIDLCRALAAVHAAGLLHRDIKAQNVMRETGGRILLMDLGTGRELTRGAAYSGADRAGTPLYLAPELFAGGRADQRTDIYSLGVLLYHLSTGAFPVHADSVEQLRCKHAQGLAVRLRDARPDLPTSFVQLVERALHTNPSERFGSAGAFEAALLAALAPERKSEPCIAVLPFANLSAEPDNEYFSDGLTEELINALSHIEGLRVVSRTSVFEFKGKALNVRTIGEQLGASAVVEGGVRRSGDRLRVTVQVVNVADGLQLWATRFDRKLTDVFEIHDEVAGTIARTLQVRFTDRPKARGMRSTGDMEAYHLYLHARFHWNRRSSKGFDKARKFYEAALRRDPDFAAAYAGLADYFISMASWGLAAPDEAWLQAERHALRAIQIDPSLADAHVSLAAFRTYYEWNWVEGEREFRRAEQLNPSDTNARVQYATQLIQLGRLSEAQAQMASALELDPLSATVNTYVAGVAYYSRHYDQALELCRKGFELAPDDIELSCVLALSYEAQGNYAEAIAAFERARRISDDYPVVVAPLAAAYRKAGRHEAAASLIEQLRHVAAVAYVPPIAWAWIHIAAGEHDQAFDWLERAVDGHDVLACYLAVGPTYDTLRSHPRFARVLQRIGLNTAVGSVVP
jgi:serine/threonine-protein kinase